MAQKRDVNPFKLRMGRPITKSFLGNFYDLFESALEIVRARVRLGVLLLGKESVLQEKSIEQLQSQSLEIEGFAATK